MPAETIFVQSAKSISMTRLRKEFWICLLLGLGTGILYWPVIHHNFINFDDGQYVIDNRAIQAGLSWQAVGWAFRTGYASNWHPLTWVSHMIDCGLYGLNPGGHHLTNLLLHTINAMLLFVLLCRMTQSLWRSACVAAIFAWHPLRVESVAWVAERKDLLCGLFWILTMMAYVRYVSEVGINKDRPGADCANSKTKLWYGTTLLLFAMALMSKPMAVTLPFVLILVDFWPLQRVRTDQILHFNAGNSSGSAAQPVLRRMLLEKLPFFALTIGDCIVTVLAQRGAEASFREAALPTRFGNAILAYADYVIKTFWPRDLAIVYPFPKHLSFVPVLAAAVMVFLMSIGFLKMANRRPYLAVGWFWFLGTLVPVIGLLQVGSQAMADRYTYIPGIGLSIVTAWGAAEILGRLQQGAKLGACLAALSLAACIIVSRRQLGYWQDSVALFGHTVAVTKDNYIAYGALGTGLQGEGQTNEALRMCTESVRLEPHYAEGQYNLGSLLLKMGRTDEAIEHFEAALKEMPRFANAENNLGKALLEKGNTTEAQRHLQAALDMAPDDPEAHYNLGTVLLMESQVPAAASQFSLALQLKPDYAEAHGNLAIALAESGHSQEAAEEFAEQVRLDPANPAARLNLGRALMAQNKPQEADVQFFEALRLQPNDAMAHYSLATAMAKEGKVQGAIAHYREALRLQPDFKQAKDQLERLAGRAN